ncbi:DUF4190 domain-containing protein [Herbiconiux sp. P17]|uniref:DUF4190 domain-containing protein n=1 Tax=Herbiconiux wuyangfengii TaxID=3342794 RepID=UPI0035B70711
MTDENQPSSGAPVPPQQPVPPAPPVPPAAPQYQAAPPVPPAAPTGAPAYQPQPGYGAAVAPVPGKTLGIVGLIVGIAGFFIVPLLGSIAGLIISIIARNQSKAASVPNSPAKAGVIVGIVGIVLSVIWIAIVVIAIVIGASALIAACGDLGPGQHIVDGVTYTCS